MKRTLLDGSKRTIESANARNREVAKDRRSLSITSEKKVNRYTIGESEGIREQTMEELMRMHPLIEKKMSNIRKKRHFH